ncbi:hypothetical protein HDU98_002096 [Podochytrium sp. JEL0797]|nr:hypothetical protein HDU98_002096 [Podochytrium sp. JEL0797]
MHMHMLYFFAILFAASSRSQIIQDPGALAGIGGLDAGGSTLSSAELGLGAGAGAGGLGTSEFGLGGGLGASGLGLGAGGVGSGLGLGAAGLGLGTQVLFIQEIVIGNVVIIDTTTLSTLSRTMGMQMGTMGAVIIQIIQIRATTAAQVQQQIIIIAARNGMTTTIIIQIAQLITGRFQQMPTILIILQTITGLGTNTGVGLGGIGSGLGAGATGLGVGGISGGLSTTTGGTVIIIVPQVATQVRTISTTLGLPATAGITIIQNTLGSMIGTGVGLITRDTAIDPNDPTLQMNLVDALQAITAQSSNLSTSSLPEVAIWANAYGNSNGLDPMHLKALAEYTVQEMQAANVTSGPVYAAFNKINTSLIQSTLALYASGPLMIGTGFTIPQAELQALSTSCSTTFQNTGNIISDISRENGNIDAIANRYGVSTQVVHCISVATIKFFPVGTKLIPSFMLITDSGLAESGSAESPKAEGGLETPKAEGGANAPKAEGGAEAHKAEGGKLEEAPKSEGGKVEAAPAEGGNVEGVMAEGDGIEKPESVGEGQGGGRKVEGGDEVMRVEGMGAGQQVIVVVLEVVPRVQAFSSNIGIPFEEGINFLQRILSMCQDLGFGRAALPNSVETQAQVLSIAEDLSSATIPPSGAFDANKFTQDLAVQHDVAPSGIQMIASNLLDTMNANSVNITSFDAVQAVAATKPSAVSAVSTLHSGALRLGLNFIFCFAFLLINL